MDDDDDTEWEKFQTRLSKREKVLEGRSKQSHSVHCPFFPEVSEILIYTSNSSLLPLSSDILIFSGLLHQGINLLR